MSRCQLRFSLHGLSLRVRLGRFRSCMRPHPGLMGLAAGRHTPPPYLSGRPYGGRAVVTRIRGAASRDRTCDARLFRPALYHLSYSGVVEVVGFEPTTPCLQGRRSANWSYTPGIGPRLYLSSRRTRRGLSGAGSEELNSRDLLGRQTPSPLGHARVIWRTVWGSNPPAQLERLLTSPEVERFVAPARGIEPLLIR